MELTTDDFLIAALRGPIRKPYFDEGKLKWRNYTFDEWATRQRVKADFTEDLRKRLFKR